MKAGLGTGTELSAVANRCNDAMLRLTTVRLPSFVLPPQALPSGVLHIDASQLSMAGAPAAQRSLPRAEVPEGAVGATLDQTVAGVVENIGRGIK